MTLHTTGKLLLAVLREDKASTEIPIKYSNFANIFSLNLVLELLDRSKINEYAIKLVEDKSPLYSLISSLNLVELETLNTYMETYPK